MKKLIYIIILAAFYSCSLFSQPDTLEYYPKDWGDSILVENQKLVDSIGNLLNSIDTINAFYAKEWKDYALILQSEIDSCSYMLLTPQYTVRMKSKNGKFTADIATVDSMFTRFTLGGTSASYITKPNNDTSFIIGQGNTNWYLIK